MTIAKILSLNLSHTSRQLKEIHLITVGKLKDSNIESLEDNYLKRLQNPKLKIHEVKAHSENLESEAIEVLKKINDICKESSPYVILLTENGKNFDSMGFSKWLNDLVENKQEKIIFVIGGAAGHGAEVISKSKESLSLSKLTYPHKLARLLLIEQFYRAGTIKNHHPYNK